MDIRYSSELSHIVPAPGVWISACDVNPPEHATISNTNIIADLLKPILVDENKNMYACIPVMPAIPPTYQLTNENISFFAPIKCKSSPISNLKANGYRSGRRSSIIPCIESPSNNEWIIATEIMNNNENCIKYTPNFDSPSVLLRLKGCGMWLQNDDLPYPGITLQPFETIHANNGETNIFEIRGVCFPTTSMTELYNNNLVERFLEKLNLRAGNHSIGFWIYKNLPNDPSPNIDKSVTIFKTLGDRRLESHLLSGLEKLIPKMFSTSFAKKIIDTFSPLYETIHSEIPSDKNRTFSRTTKLNLSKIAGFIVDLFDQVGDLKYEFLSDESLEKIGILSTKQIYKILQSLQEKSDDDKQINDFINMIKLFGRLGFESGRCLAAVHRSGLVWGTYVDHNPSELHCNAHGDNFIVLSKEEAMKTGKMQILAPVDFDMSFKKEQAISIWTQPFSPDETYATNVFSTEVSNLISDIAGLTATIPGMSTAIHPREAPKGDLNTLLWLLRDCSIYELIQGYIHPNSECCEGNNISLDNVYQLIELGLIETADEQS